MMARKAGKPLALVETPRRAGSLSRGRPVEGAADRFAPPAAEPLALVGGNRRCKLPLQCPVAGDVGQVAPETGGQPRQIGRAKRCSLRHAGTQDVDPQQVRLELARR